MQLDNTVIIPEDDSELAEMLFDSIVYEEAVLVMVVLGDDEDSRKAVRLADRLAKISIQGFERKVIWIRKRDQLTTKLSDLKRDKKVMLPLKGAKAGDVIAIAISLADTVKDVVMRTQGIDFVRLDQAFQKAGT